MAATSFQKKTRGKIIQIPGAKPSLYNNQLLVSSGVPSMDNVLGGGLAVGTVLLVEEDNFGNYSRLLMKYFCAEAAVTGHALMLTSTDQCPEQLLKELPAPIVDDPESRLSADAKGSNSEKMDIAWRYQHLPKVQSSPVGVKFGNYYDLTKVMSPDLVNGINTELLGSEELECSCTKNDAMNPKYKLLLEKIKDKIDTGNFHTGKQVEKRNILRIALHSLGSPLWGENGGYTTNHEDYDFSLPRFLLALRSLLRSAFAVCMITIPTHLFQSETYVGRLRKLCDAVVHMESFAGSDKEKNPAFKDYHGLFNIRQLPRLNSLLCHMPDTLDLAFKLRRKKFTIEKLHLPPELSDSASRPQEDPVISLKPSQTPCGSSKNSKLDF